MTDPADDHAHDPVGPDDVVVRIAAIEAILSERGLVDPVGIEAMIQAYETRIGPRIGARLVARAWLDPGYRALVVRDARAAADLIHPSRLQGDLIVVENTPEVHNVVVCTLCSCYPWNVLGLPPNWYKSMPYRSRVVREPRKVLAELGCEVPATKEVRVWDSSSELRYMVLPERPPGTEGMGEDDLAALVHRDAMIGVGIVRGPREAAGA